MGLASSTIRDIEASPAIPQARLAEFTEALGLAEALNGAVISGQRKSAGWTLEQVADRTGVTLSVVHTWESGARPIPPGRLILLAAALQAATSESPTLQAMRRRELVDKVIADVATNPGATRRAVAHRLRSLSLGRLGPRFDGVAAISEALESGEVAEVIAAERGPRGRLNERPRMYLPDAVPAGHDTPSLTSNELRERRGQLGVSQRELGEAIGVSQTMIGYFERQDAGRLASWQSARLVQALDAFDSRSDAERGAVLTAIDEDPGIARDPLLSRLGHTNAVRRQIESLILAGEVVLAPGVDSLGRERPGFYLRGAEPAPLDRFEPGELGALIRANGWTPAELAVALGIRPNRISRWETGVRQCSPGWSERIRTALAGAPPVRLDPKLPRLLALVDRPGGIAAGDLPPVFSQPRGRASVADAIDAGLIRVEERLVPRQGDGRIYARRYLVMADASVGSPPDRMTGDELSGRLAGAGLSQSELARRLGISADAVNRWARGRGVPPSRLERVRSELQGAEPQ
jgi:transcriptional regulator with XRE-family HTH domain